jgi:hypothetical protein
VPSAIHAADLFLDQGLVITRVDCSYPPALQALKLPVLGAENAYRTSRETEFEKMPVVVLVNRGSASASEMLAGALRDNGRAKVIGETTYGKGVGQGLITLTSAVNRRYLIFTVLEYRTPNGDMVQKTGVDPDIAFPARMGGTEEFLAAYDLRASGVLAAYLDRRWDKHGDLFADLAKYDGFEWKRYPGFDAFFGSLETTLERDRVRRELRREIRRRIALETRTPFICDAQADVQLQRAIVELLEAPDKQGRFKHPPPPSVKECEWERPSSSPSPSSSAASPPRRGRTPTRRNASRS